MQWCLQIGLLCAKDKNMKLTAYIFLNLKDVKKITFHWRIKIFKSYVDNVKLLKCAIIYFSLTHKNVLNLTWIISNFWIVPLYAAWQQHYITSKDGTFQFMNKSCHKSNTCKCISCHIRVSPDCKVSINQKKYSVKAGFKVLDDCNNHKSYFATRWYYFYETLSF